MSHVSFDFDGKGRNFYDWIYGLMSTHNFKSSGQCSILHPGDGVLFSYDRRTKTSPSARGTVVSGTLYSAGYGLITNIFRDASREGYRGRLGSEEWVVEGYIDGAWFRSEQGQLGSLFGNMWVYDPGLPHTKNYG
jgi:hypothetical protein